MKTFLHLVPVVLGLTFTPAISFAQAPANAPSEQQVSPEETSARIILVEWRIKKGREHEFLEYWSKRSTIPDRSGLIGEFLSRVEDRKQFPWMVWSLDKRWTTFVNVGFWKTGADFQEQIGKFIDNSKPPLAFEAQRRRRVFVAPERWRIGASPFFASDHSSVR
ncbi:hypothetical protein [Microvirga terricola]|uniref:ABM domain-containing protein n=1 Tax=Microvirga terricola TaxID=2719797 RepID=A0ABX0VGI5_9HYPH|nr:hypothetical protein [Microvirga terricola]NIX77880.1 hypothetical protein [Microvirga terricola]